MIRDFWVKNYLSIQDKQSLDFLTKGPASDLVVEIAKGVFLYKLGVLYGPNASGKSNMLFAINEIFNLLAMPKSDSTEKIMGCIPFALTKDKPTEMHVSFYVDGIRYDYDVVFNNRVILSEVLNFYPNNSKALFYERSFVGDQLQSDIKFGSNLKLSAKTQGSIRENVLNNHSVLSVCRKAAFKEDIEQFNKLHKWIMSNYHNVDGDEKPENGIIEILEEASNDAKKKAFFKQMLHKADLNIIDFFPTVKNRDIPSYIRERIQKENIPDEWKEEILKPTSKTIEFDNHSQTGDFKVPLNLQSKGTIKFIRILGVLYDLISGPHVYYLDELGEDLHYDLLFFYLNVFLFNSDCSQLIITSQETSLLSQELINDNRGTVWFVDKNKNTASSEYSRGDSFGLHKNLSLFNSYNAGRLGAKPELGSMFVNLDEETYE